MAVADDAVARFQARFGELHRKPRLESEAYSSEISQDVGQRLAGERKVRGALVDKFYAPMTAARWRVAGGGRRSVCGGDQWKDQPSASHASASYEGDQLRYHTTMHVVNIRAEVVFQALADATRLRVLRVLATGREEACLCELVDSLLEPQYKLSRHLKVLRQVGLLAAEKDGRFVYHKLVAQHRHLKRLYAAICALPDREGVFAADLRRFTQRMRLRESGRCRIGIQTASFAAAQPDASAKRSA